MKILSTLFIVTLNVVLSFSQSDYEQAVKNGLESFYQSSTFEEMQAASNQFERIADAAPDEWIPRYYNSYINTILAFKTQDTQQKQAYTDKAQVQLDEALKIAPKESELFTLQGMLYQAVIGIDPVINGQIYSGKASAAFSDAIRLNSQNPRPYYLQGINIMHTPEQYGGGNAAALPKLLKASELFENFKPASDIAPNWGREDCAAKLEECKSTN